MTAKVSALSAQRILLAEEDDSMRGFLTRELTKAGYEVVGFDISPAMVDLSRTRVPGGRFVCQSFVDAVFSLFASRDYKHESPCR